MEALGNLTNMIDEIKDKLTDDQYLTMMNHTKSVHEMIVSEVLLERIRSVTNCLEHGVFCVCNIDKRVEKLYYDNQIIPNLLRIIACQTGERYDINIM
jgi:hypothetical protein